MEYAARVAENDPFQLRMIKLSVNQAQDAQGGYHKRGQEETKRTCLGHYDLHLQAAFREGPLTGIFEGCRLSSKFR